MLKELNELINKNIQRAAATLNEATIGDSSITVDSSSIHQVIQYLRDNTHYSFNALQVISGVDHVDYLEVCYMLCNFDENAPRDVIIKTQLKDRVNPELDSVCDIFLAANYQERECYDMLGVKFKNHPDPRRILCPDDWIGYPLRKDYMVQKTYRNMEVYPVGKLNLP